MCVSVTADRCEKILGIGFQNHSVEPCMTSLFTVKTPNTFLFPLVKNEFN